MPIDHTDAPWNPRHVRILIVDDEEIVREILGAHLASQGYDCTHASNCAEAQARLAERPFELCFIDVHMPDKSGIDLLVYLREYHEDTAAVMLTGVYDANIAVTSMKLGAYDYVTKPFERDDLLIRLRQVLEKRHLKLENRLYREQLEELVEQRTRELNQRNEQLEKLMLSTIESFALTLQLRNQYTEGHSQQVAYWSVQIAQEMGLDPKLQLEVYHAALLHDMGKMAIPDAILDKPAELMPKEYHQMQQHPSIGHEILHPIASVVDGFQAVADAVCHHHEHYDGSGYPDGLAGVAIPLFARIISVADAHDSMANPRPYRAARPGKLVLEELERCAGTQFDPEIVRMFVKRHEKMAASDAADKVSQIDPLEAFGATASYVLEFAGDDD